MRCDLLEQQRGQLLRTIEAPDLHVLAQTAEGQRFEPAIPRGMAGISCGRTSVIPAAWDDQVLALGLPLFIAEDGHAGPGLASWRSTMAAIGLRLIRGQAQPEEQAQIDARIQALSGAVRRPAQRSLAGSNSPHS